MLVTGAAGMLGTDLVAQLEERHEVTAVDLEVDVTDPGAVRACVEGCRPEAVFHLAAFTDVDAAEEREDEAARINTDGAANVGPRRRRGGRGAGAAVDGLRLRRHQGRALHRGRRGGAAGAYGRTKFAGERAARALCPGTRVARTAWLYGAAGRNFVDTMRRLGAERDEVSVVDDQEGSPTWTRELGPALEALLEQPPGVYHAAGAGSVTWAGLAAAVFEEAGLDCRVRPITTAELGRPAPRPALSALAVTRPGAPRLRPWREALADYLVEAS